MVCFFMSIISFSNWFTFSELWYALLDLWLFQLGKLGSLLHIYHVKAYGLLGLLGLLRLLFSLTRFFWPNQFREDGRTPFERLPNCIDAMHKMVCVCQLLSLLAWQGRKLLKNMCSMYVLVVTTSVWEVKSSQYIYPLLLLFYTLSILVVETEKEELTNLIFKCILKCAPDVTMV